MAKDKKNKLFVTLERAQRAYRGLELSVVTQADKVRMMHVWQGLKALDDENARIKGGLEELILEYWNPNANDSEFDEFMLALFELIGPTAKPREAADAAAFDSIINQLREEKKTCLPTSKTPRKKT